ncbi:hypothetical protein OPT61_g5425 [Boeremia exigua]|uniref:Uncharacterized protein n=1 Tax=Boeremia exigua TaxID=749465 RepID=A0ACC2IAB3_9PLEO|nr:hypothetical protein OPT61_g5425 [Boeremia exigua]
MAQRSATLLVSNEADVQLAISSIKSYQIQSNCKITTQFVVTGSERRGRLKTIQPGDREWVTVIAAINAAGWLVPPFLIFASKYHFSAWYEEEEIPRDWAIALDVQLRTPTPPAALAEALWEARTPSNARELEAQSTLIRERVRQHKSLSPASIIEAINQLKKGAEVMMLSAELMRDWIAGLERANEAASARRQRKKKRLQKRGVLTKGAGEDMLAQRKADQQIACEERQGGERSGLSCQALARCKSCRETGHNSPCLTGYNCTDVPTLITYSCYTACVLAETINVFQKHSMTGTPRIPPVPSPGPRTQDGPNARSAPTPPLYTQRHGDMATPPHLQVATRHHLLF